MRKIQKTVHLPVSLGTVVDSFIVDRCTFTNLATAALLRFLSVRTSANERNLWLRTEWLMRKRKLPFRKAFLIAQGEFRREAAA